MKSKILRLYWALLSIPFIVFALLISDVILPDYIIIVCVAWAFYQILAYPIIKFILTLIK